MPAPVFDPASLPFVEEMFARFRENPQLVDAEWRAYFSGWLAGAENGVPAVGSGGDVSGGQGSNAFGAGDACGLDRDKAAGVSQLIRAWRTRGHLLAKVNPLFTDQPNLLPELTLGFYGLGQNDLDTRFASQGVVPEKTAPLRDIFSALQVTYGGFYGVESAPLQDIEQREWVQRWWEGENRTLALPDEVRKALWLGLMKANAFETFLHTKFVGVKRFSIEGNDVVLPLVEQLAAMAAEAGGKHVVIGMAHRGRLNMLCNLLHKPLEEMLAGFADTLTVDSGKSGAEQTPFSGDVKYHMGKQAMVDLPNGHSIDMRLLFNPSHLEAVNPMVLGMAKALQTFYGPAHHHEAFDSVLPILLHGDSAVIGQGVVAECANLMKLPAYDVGGTIHIVINNQIGFTADPVDAFSGEYCTDVFRGYGMPIVHVNADDADACWRAVRFAFEFRRAFKRDVVVDVVGYRRWGHNEGDDPTFTQPVMYRAIKEHAVAADIYAQRLHAEGALDEQEAKQMIDAYKQALQQAYTAAQAGVTTHVGGPTVKTGRVQTGVSRAALNKVIEAWENVPSVNGKLAELNPKVKKVIDERVAMLRGEHLLNWGAAETAAYGTLLQQGIGWRLTGQDIQRGTFSHRHAVLTLNEDGAKWAPLAALRAKNDRGALAKHEVFNSALSENAVLGFEYGYALADSDTLVMWEAQFGDFANGAQVVIDQFLAAGEAKWAQGNPLTLLLPHGYEGQGPEHSSARIERFLQLCAENNMRVALPSTPAQIFHLLRLQALVTHQGGARKPLVVFTPKSLLRHPAAVSPVDDLIKGAFMPVIEDHEVPIKGAKKVLLCSGRVYYDLLARRQTSGRDDVSILRLEQLYPLPTEALATAFKDIRKKTVCWVQDEPRNMGAFGFVRDNWQPDWGFLYGVTRPASASPAVGSMSKHAQQQAALLDEIFG